MYDEEEIPLLENIPFNPGGTGIPHKLPLRIALSRDNEIQ